MAGTRKSFDQASGAPAASGKASGGKLTQAQKVKLGVAVVCIVVGAGLAAYSLDLFGGGTPKFDPATHDPYAGMPEGTEDAHKKKQEEMQRMRDAAKARGQPLVEGAS